MTDALSIRQPVTASLHLSSYSDVKDLAQMLSAAPPGLIPKAYQGSAPGIFACLLRGIGLGLDPMEALANIHVIEGKAILSSELMLSIVMRKGVQVEWTKMEDDEVECRLTRPGHPVHHGRWTIEDARRAGLAGKDIWKKYPRAMLRARCISEAIRAWAPDLLGAGVYDETEADEVRDHAERAAPAPRVTVIDAKIEAPAKAEGDADRSGPAVCAYAAAQSDADMTAAKGLIRAWWATRTKEEANAVALAASAARVRLDAAKAAATRAPTVRDEPTVSHLFTDDEAAEIARSEREAEVAS